MRYLLCIINLFFLLDNPLRAQYENENVLPFQLIDDRMIVRLNTNIGKLNLVFDIASNVSMIDFAKAEEFSKSGFNSQNKSDTRYFKGIKIKGNKIPDVKWIIKDFKQESKKINYPLDGLYGAYALIKQRNVLIDFENKEIVIGSEFNFCIDSSLVFEMSSVNKSDKVLGTLFPHLISIRDTINFKPTYSKKIELIVDTGSKYGFAFIAQDSTLIDSIFLFVDDYTLWGDMNNIGFTLARSNGLDSNFYKSPVFIRPGDTKMFSNKFYGLLGIPVLKKFDKIYFHWSSQKIIFL